MQGTLKGPLHALRLQHGRLSRRTTQIQFPDRRVAGLVTLIMGATSAHGRHRVFYSSIYYTTHFTFVSRMLPFELLEYIVDFLHDDSNALRACSLTCQSLIPAARKYLFRRIVLKRVSDTLRFLQALDSSADTQFSVASYVRDLRLPFMGFVKGGKKQRRYELVRRVLRNLQHLSQLRMYTFDWLGFMESLRVDAGAGSLRDAMAAFFPLQELKELIIDHLVSRSSYELTLFISIFPQLEQLEMRQLISLHAPGTWVPLPDAPGGWDKDLPAAGEMGTHLRTLAVSFDLGSQTMAGRVLGRLLSSPFHVQCSHIEWETCQVALRREDDIDEGVLLMAVLRASELTLESLRVSCSDDGESSQCLAITMTHSRVPSRSVVARP